MVVDNPARWPRVLLELRLLLERRFQIRHSTIQPELPGDEQVVVITPVGSPLRQNH